MRVNEAKLREKELEDEIIDLKRNLYSQITV